MKFLAQMQKFTKIKNKRFQQKICNIWRQWRRRFLITLVVVVIIVLIQPIVWPGGFGFSQKTLWNWLEIIGIPISLAFLGAWLQQLQQQRITEEAKAEKDRAHLLEKQRDKLANEELKEAALQVYFDRLSTLLIDQELLAVTIKSDPLEEKAINHLKIDFTTEKERILTSARDIIRARTLATLRRFHKDKTRKTSVIQFLIETDILKKLKINLDGADLSETRISKSKANTKFTQGLQIFLDSMGIPLEDYFNTHDVLSAVNKPDFEAKIPKHSRVDLSEISFRAVNFSKSYLVEVDFSKANLVEANLSEANLNGAILLYAQLGSANLYKANLCHAKLGSAILVGADLRHSQFSEADLSKADLSRADLSNSNFSPANLCEAKIICANLCQAKFWKANLSGVNFAESHLNAAEFYMANLSGSDLSGTDLDGVEFDGSNLKGANLSGAYNNSPVISSFSKANLSRANLSGAKLTNANFADSDLSNANLTASDLIGANFSNANLNNAQFYHVNLSEAIFMDADLSGIEWDTTTTWPNKEKLFKAKNVPDLLKKQLGL